MRVWQLQEAKAKFSQVVQEAIKSPQAVSVRGKTTAVILSAEKYMNLTDPKKSFVNFLQDSPLFKLEIDLTRDKSNCRKIDGLLN